MPKRKTRTKYRVAENLNRRRRWRKLTQQRLADRVGVDRTTIWRWETARLFPDPEAFDRLSIVLEVDVQAFFREPSKYKRKAKR